MLFVFSFLLRLPPLLLLLGSSSSSSAPPPPSSSSSSGEYTCFSSPPSGVMSRAALVCFSRRVCVCFFSCRRPRRRKLCRIFSFCVSEFAFVSLRLFFFFFFFCRRWFRRFRRRQENIPALSFSFLLSSRLTGCWYQTPRKPRLPWRRQVGVCPAGR